MFQLDHRQRLIAATARSFAGAKLAPDAPASGCSKPPPGDRDLGMHQILQGTDGIMRITIGSGLIKQPR